MKNLVQMELNIQAYLKTNGSYIRGRMSERFKDSWKIPLKKQRFFKGFIDGMSTLYTKPFDRFTTMTPEIQSVLNEVMIDAEKYHNISRESLIYIRSAMDFKAMDPSEYVLFPNEQEFKIVFIKNGDTIYKFEAGKEVTFKKCKLKECQDYDPKNEKEWFPLEEPELDDAGEPIDKSIEELPFIVIRHPRLQEPQFNELVELEADRIIDISWGFYNATPKMLTQTVIKSAKNKDEVKEMVGDDLGRRSSSLVMGQGDDIGTIDMGDLSNLKDIMDAWKLIIQDEALMAGVDKNKVIASNEPISGESKKVELNYINEVRDSNAPIFKKAEKDFVIKYNVLFGTSFEFDTIVFLPLNFGSQDANNVYSDNNSQIL